MTDTEFITEVRRAIIQIVGACIKRYGLTWREFMPRSEARMIDAQNSDTKNATPFPRALELNSTPTIERK